jgi:putative N6-adenine-specific DNA methylase
LNTESSLLKRIKRHVTGPVHAFFASTPPGFEELCKYELVRLPVDKDGVKILEGGVEFRGKLIDCYLANLYLRTANRVLFRIAGFKSQISGDWKGISWRFHGSFI